MFIFEKERERAGEGHIERRTEDAKQSLLRAESPMRGLNSRTVRSCLEPKSDAQETEPPRCPPRFFLLITARVAFYHTVKITSLLYVPTHQRAKPLLCLLINS